MNKVIYTIKSASPERHLLSVYADWMFQAGNLTSSRAELTFALYLKFAYLYESTFAEVNLTSSHADLTFSLYLKFTYPYENAFIEANLPLSHACSSLEASHALSASYTVQLNRISGQTNLLII